MPPTVPSWATPRLGYPGQDQPLVYGGAIRNEAGQVNLRSCTFVGNRPPVRTHQPATRATGRGAIHNSGTATLDLCTLAGNSATGGGGANGALGYGGSRAAKVPAGRSSTRAR